MSKPGYAISIKTTVFERHRHADFAKSFIILTEDVAKLRTIFMGKKANLVKFIWFVKYFFNVFAADLNLRKNVFHIHKPPSFLLWRIPHVLR